MRHIPGVKLCAEAVAVEQDCIKLRFEGSPARGGDSLYSQFQVYSAGDKLSPPLKAEVDAALAVEHQGSAESRRALPFPLTLRGASAFVTPRCLLI